MPKKVVIIMDDFREFIADKLKLWLSDYIIESAVKRKHIHIDNNLRGIGKTTAIAKFANMAKVALVVPNEYQVRCIKYNFDMCVPVVSQHNIDTLRDTKWMLVFDEGVNPDNLDGFKVVTGFVNY
ncbi:hypothetical protein M5X00_29505 [Paenibacillus alvei]|uniref:hypothetical protein n=2 Tax=Paenibacillus alvei TaxID=44250 RepID=UPI0022817EF4|nr:hypothetical protein [Paenibacillus alvei]MCY9707614.1 hypothetical protein [Paenibacillus alvei]MCY9758357.1 hypothetical protein [Paenibacillus alvei]